MWELMIIQANWNRKTVRFDGTLSMRNSILSDHPGYHGWWELKDGKCIECSL